MNRLLRVVLLIMAGGLPGAVFATCQHSQGADFCGPDPISLLYVTSSGLIYVQPSGLLQAIPAGFTCSPVAGSYFVLDPKASNFQQIYALLLSARSTGAGAVTLVADPAQSTCTILYATF
jgi:hypothetical protein